MFCSFPHSSIPIIGKTCIPKRYDKAFGSCLPFISSCCCCCSCVYYFDSSSPSYSRFVPGTGNTHSSPQSRTRPYPSDASINPFCPILILGFNSTGLWPFGKETYEASKGSVFLAVFKASCFVNFPAKEVEFFINGYCSDKACWYFGFFNFYFK